MSQTATIILTALATLIVTVLGGVLLDLIRNRRPTISYSAKDAVAIDLGEHKSVGAYVVGMTNTSKRVVKEIECHIQAGTATLRNGGLATPQGLQVEVRESEKCLSVSAAYLRPGESIQITVIAEGYYVPRSPDIAIRSPYDVRLVKVGEANPGGFPFRYVLSGAVAAGAGLLVPTLLGIYALGSSQKDTLAFAASIAGLPTLAQSYALAPDLTYFNQGDMAYALAAHSTNRDEMQRYRVLLDVTLQVGTMASASRANLCYSLGRIDLLLGDKARAAQDFREAVKHSRTLVSEKCRQEGAVREFLTSNGIM